MAGAVPIPSRKATLDLLANGVQRTRAGVVDDVAWFFGELVVRCSRDFRFGPTHQRARSDTKSAISVGSPPAAGTTARWKKRESRSAPRPNQCPSQDRAVPGSSEARTRANDFLNASLTLPAPRESPGPRLQSSAKPASSRTLPEYRKCPLIFGQQIVTGRRDDRPLGGPARLRRAWAPPPSSAAWRTGSAGGSGSPSAG